MTSLIRLSSTRLNTLTFGNFDMQSCSNTGTNVADVCSSPRRFLDMASLIVSSSGLVDRDGRNDDDALEHELPLRIHAEQAQTVVQYANNQATEHCAENRTAAAR